jgi:flagellar hook protein FlgE
MMRSLFAGVSGLRNSQVRMDVIGNNVANVNTVAFKSSRVTFKEGFAQLLQGGSRPPGDHGGINPIQVGLGMQVGSIDQMMTQGNIETTGGNTDLAIQGSAFFVVAKGNEHFYTRAGNFQLDADGRLVSPTNGFVVQGRIAKQGVLQEGITNIKLPLGQKTEARPTSEVTLGGNLNAEAPVFSTALSTSTPPSFDAAARQDPNNVGAYTSTTISVYDSIGTKHDLKLWLYKTSSTDWNYEVDTSGLQNTTGLDSGGTGTLKFNIDGTLDLANSTVPDIQFTPSNADQVTIDIDPGSSVNGITQFAGNSNTVLRNQDGYGMGELVNFTIDRTGKINGYFTNGTNVLLGQIALADFNNPGGLLRSGDDMYTVSGNSGSPILSYPLEGSQSFVTSGALEMSNVDLASEFTNMIVTERGFQANGRVISTSDEMLQEVVNLKR